MSTMFQKRHYIAIAKLLHVHWLFPERRSTTIVIAESLSDLFAKDNPLYDRERFIETVLEIKGGK